MDILNFRCAGHPHGHGRDGGRCEFDVGVSRGDGAFVGQRVGMVLSRLLGGWSAPTTSILPSRGKSIALNGSDHPLAAFVR